MIARNDQRSNERGLSRKVRVLVYDDEKSRDAYDSSGMYMLRSLASDPFFQVTLSTDANPKLAESADVVISKFDPPIKEEFLDGLERYNDGSRLFINNPNAQRYFSNKKYLENIAREYPEILPKTVISSDPTRLGRFLYDLRSKGIRDFVSKPTHGCDGKGVEKIVLNGESIQELIGLCYGLSEGNEIILQEFNKGVTEYGDKRIHVINGEPIGAALRIPKNGEFICSEDKGVSFVKSEITSKDYEIVQKVLPLIREKQVYWAGVDIVGSYLGEINAVSPGILYLTDKLNGNLYRKGGVGNKFVEKIKKDVKLLNRNMEPSLV